MLTVSFHMCLAKTSQTFTPRSKKPEHVSKKGDSRLHDYASKFWHMGDSKTLLLRNSMLFFNYLSVIKGLDSEARVSGVQWGLWVS